MRLAILLIGTVALLAGAIGVTGAVTIYEIQYTTNPSGASPYVGQDVTVTGIVTGTSYYGFVIAEAPGPWHGIFVYSQNHAPNVGDEVELSGTVSEYYSQTEIEQITSYVRLSTGNEIDPWLVDSRSG